MNPDALTLLSAGFAHEAFGSQAVFRAALQALSHPGRVTEVRHDAQTPAVGHSASAAVLLALLDDECRLWLSPSLQQGSAADWLRFHTGCQLVVSVAQAQFLWVAQGDALPPLSTLAQGSDLQPEHSATCFIDLPLLSDRPDGASSADAWRLSGPGIREHQSLRAQGLPTNFLSQWGANHAAFPRGVDIYLACADHIVGLPRTTRIETQPEH
jgi:alpha-D-ribose 1-methylphosphonate 5-triphosphate synthase subunit PhnH